jgi:hypothetical protein
MAWILEADKKFAVIGNMNAITYKEIFPLIKENKIWLGATNFNKGMYFGVPENFVYASTYKFEREQNGIKVNRVPGVCWYSNLEHGRRYQPLTLMNMIDNKKFSKHKEIKNIGYIKYDNYDAIEVPFADAIPSDFSGIMGVPISFLDKYCPDQFEIVNLSRYLEDSGGMSIEFVQKYYEQGNKGQISEGHPDLCYFDNNGNAIVPYMRILIRHKNQR